MALVALKERDEFTACANCKSYDGEGCRKELRPQVVGRMSGGREILDCRSFEKKVEKSAGVISAPKSEDKPAEVEVKAEEEKVAEKVNIEATEANAEVEVKKPAKAKTARKRTTKK